MIFLMKKSGLLSASIGGEACSEGLAMLNEILIVTAF